MFNNIIYFLIVLLIFEINYPEHSIDSPLLNNLAMAVLCWAMLAAYSGAGFDRLLRLSRAGQDTGLSARYHALVLRLSVLAILIFALDVNLFHLKYWFRMIPLSGRFSVLQGIPAIALFMFYLSTIWYFAYPVYAQVFQSGVRRMPFIISNIKLNIPVIFPWIILTFIYDIITVNKWSGPGGLLEQPESQMIFFAVFMCVLVVIMPPFIQYWWDCKPLESSERVNELKKFLSEIRFRYAGLLRWPLFEGRMMTAAIMGIAPRLRYILITDSLMDALSLDELKAVLAHEAGHARYRHMWIYVIFLLGYMFLSFGLFDIFYYILASQPRFIKNLGESSPYAANAFYLVLSVPVILSMFIYFRFILGFFMRNFERQADLYSANIMGTPFHTVNSLEKIALLSGKIRDLPSWHHFSIKERVECLLDTLKKPDLAKRHNRFVAVSFMIYLICTLSLGYLLNFSPLKQGLYNRLAGRTLEEQALKEPYNIAKLQSLAMFYHETGKYSDAKAVYERILELDSIQPTSLNNLAWLLTTVPDERLKDPARALILAKKAVELERSQAFLDTLAEAYWANGYTEQAIETIKEAISLEKEDRSYYQKQLKKFTASSNVR